MILLALCTTAVCAAAVVSTPPNILVIVADEYVSSCLPVLLLATPATLTHFSPLQLPPLTGTAAPCPTAVCLPLPHSYGWNDVGYHGSELATPAIDALAAEGVKLENYYVLPVCTPTRSALLASRYPFKTGLQTSTISPAKPYGLHLNYSTLADELQERGYKTHAVGKWQ